jgi:hypothetical protein
MVVKQVTRIGRSNQIDCTYNTLQGFNRKGLNWSSVSAPNDLYDIALDMGSGSDLFEVNLDKMKVDGVNIIRRHIMTDRAVAQCNSSNPFLGALSRSAELTLQRDMYMIIEVYGATGTSSDSFVENYQNWEDMWVELMTVKLPQSEYPNVIPQLYNEPRGVSASTLLTYYRNCISALRTAGYDGLILVAPLNYAKNTWNFGWNGSSWDDIGGASLLGDRNIGVICNFYWWFHVDGNRCPNNYTGGSPASYWDNPNAGNDKSRIPLIPSTENVARELLNYYALCDFPSYYSFPSHEVSSFRSGSLSTNILNDGDQGNGLPVFIGEFGTHTKTDDNIAYNVGYPDVNWHGYTQDIFNDRGIHYCCESFLAKIDFPTLVYKSGGQVLDEWNQTGTQFISKLSSGIKPRQDVAGEGDYMVMSDGLGNTILYRYISVTTGATIRAATDFNAVKIATSDGAKDVYLEWKVA